MTAIVIVSLFVMTGCTWAAILALSGWVLRIEQKASAHATEVATLRTLLSKDGTPVQLWMVQLRTGPKSVSTLTLAAANETEALRTLLAMEYQPGQIVRLQQLGD
jgi:hypothetical protein